MSTASNNDLNAGVLLSGVGATASQNSADQLNPYGRGIKLFVNVTNAGTGSITVTIQGKDPASGTYYNILASSAITANGLTALSAYPGLTAAANSIANDVLPRQWRVQVTANNSNPMNYSIGACVVV